MSRRYLPFLVLTAVQLLLALTVPSIAPGSDRVSVGGQFTPGDNGGVLPDGSGDPAAATEPGAPGADGLNPADPNAPTSGDPAAGGNAGGDGSTGTSTGGGGGGGTTPDGQAAPKAKAPAAADKSHCKNGRQFDDFAAAPPCVAKFPKGADNGGKTANGVSAKEIRVVYYRAKDNPAVNALLTSVDLGSTAQQENSFLQAATKFINAKYETYGRTVRADFFQGNCSTSPPVDSCFRDDAKVIAKKFSPFAVIWQNNTNAPAFHDQLSRMGIVNLGGWHFSDSFRTGLRPYNYDIFMGGDFQGRLTGDYWCKRLAGKPARYAGAQYRSTKRKVAILYPETPVKAGPAQTLLKTIRGCDNNGPQVLSYSPNIDQASQQSTALVAKLKRDGVTSVMIFGDPIAPAFFTKTATQQAYFPEHVLVGSGLIDYDLLARLYDQQQWVHAFGVSDLVRFKAFAQTDANRVWKSAGGSGNAYSGANTPWGYLSTLAYGVQFSGAKLSPATFERALLSINDGGWAKTKDPERYFLKYGKGDYTAISDAREAYWDPNATSRVDGKKGAYIGTEGGRRWVAGEWSKGDPRVPSGFGQ